LASPDSPDGKPLYTQQRKGRWYWEPPLRLRRSHGLEVKSLGADQAAAWAYARTLNRDLAGLKPGAGVPGSVAWLFEQFFESERFGTLAPSTQGDYKWLAKRINGMQMGAQQLGQISARAIRPRHADKIYAVLKAESGPSASHYACRFARRVWKWGARREFVDAAPNPWASMELASIPQREQRWLVDQVEALVACCQENGRGSIALAIILAYWLGHRQGDVLSLTWAQLTAGERRTGKTKARAALSTTVYLELDAALDAERERQRKMDIRPVAVVVMEDTSEPWDVNHFRHEFRRLARLAGIPDDLQFRDLRATALTELADAGADVIDMSTHSTHKTVQMARRYARPTAAQFDRAATKRMANRKNKPETDDGTATEPTELNTVNR
jgi:integrase